MNNYYDIAEDDLKEAEDRFQAGRFNKCAVWCQQAGEKYLKYVLIDKLGVTGDGDSVKDKEDARIIGGHNLKKIYERIIEVDNKLKVPTSALFALTNYYLKARYPGEGYVEIDSETAEELLEYAKSVKGSVDDYVGVVPLNTALQDLAAKYGRLLS